MAAEKPTTPKPSIGRIVTYRNRHGVDIPAMITAVIEGDDEAVHLEQFAPPGVSKDALSYQWGVAYAEEPRRGTWRWPERV